MSIKILKKSFTEHITVKNTVIETAYQMTWEDYYNTIGDLVDQNKDLITANFHLPYIGDSFDVYYSTGWLTNAVLVDISMEATNALVEEFDTTLQDLDREVIVTYTWSNDGDIDTQSRNEAGSWKIRFDTTLETVGLDNYVGSVDGTKFFWANKYLTELNPQVVLTKLDDDGAEEEVGAPTYGLYNTESTAIKKKYIDSIRDEIPIVQKRTPRTSCTVTAFSSEIKGGTLVELIGKVNSVDFLQFVYQQRDAARTAKNKTIKSTGNSFIGGDDTGKWMFVDWDMEDIGNDFFEYTFIFEYDKIGWNTYADADMTLDVLLYKTENFYNAILLGMDNTSPNDRNAR
jgi:hypothetical protein